MMTEIQKDYLDYIKRYDTNNLTTDDQIEVFTTLIKKILHNNNDYEKAYNDGYNDAINRYIKPVIDDGK